MPALQDGTSAGKLACNLQCKPTEVSGSETKRSCSRRITCHNMALNFTCKLCTHGPAESAAVCTDTEPRSAKLRLIASNRSPSRNPGQYYFMVITHVYTQRLLNQHHCRHEMLFSNPETFHRRKIACRHPDGNVIFARRVALECISPQQQESASQADSPLQSTAQHASPNPTPTPSPHSQSPPPSNPLPNTADSSSSPPHSSANSTTTSSPRAPDGSKLPFSTFSSPTPPPVDNSSIPTTPPSDPSFSDAVLISYLKAFTYFMRPLVMRLEKLNTEEEEAALEVKRNEDLRNSGVDETPDEVFNELLKLGFFLKFLTVGTFFYGIQLSGHYDAAHCVRSTLGLTAGFLVAPFCKIEPLTAVLKRQFDDRARVYSAEEFRDSLNSVGLILLVLLIVPRYTEGWDLPTDLQVVIPLMAGWGLSQVVDDWAIAIFLKNK